MDDQVTFLAEPPSTEAARALYSEEIQSDGYVSNFSRVWCWRPDVFTAFNALRAGLIDESALTFRDRAILVTATAAERRDSYCSLAWGARLAEASDETTAAQVIDGNPAFTLSDREATLAAWARQIVRDPNATTAANVERLRDVGLGDREIFEATVFIAFRLAFSTINDALGACPDKQLADRTPASVRAAVSYGRAPMATPSGP